MSLSRNAGLTLALFFPIMSASASTSPTCDGVSNVRCPPPAKRLIEIPSGAIDGNNNVFMLTMQPSDLTELRLFKNGYEMAQGVEFQVNGREITIGDHFIPSKGSLLQASYVTALPSVGSRGIEVAQDRVHTLTRAILLNSVGASSLPPTAAVASAPATQVLSRTLTTPGQKLDASLNLLSRRIKERRAPVHGLDVHDNNDKLSSSGFEGMGDGSLPSPFAALLDPAAPITLERSLAPTKYAGASSHHSLRSLSMLEQRLDSTATADVHEESR